MESIKQEERDPEEYSESEEEEDDDEDDDAEDETPADEESTDGKLEDREETAASVKREKEDSDGELAHQEASSSSAPHPEDLAAQFEVLDISDLSDERLSRSPPESRRHLPSEEGVDIKSKVASDISKQRAQQKRKYHSKRSTRNAGRSQGSKAKQDTRVRMADHGGFWS